MISGESRRFLEENRDIFIGLLDKSHTEATGFYAHYALHPIYRGRKIISALARYRRNYYIKCRPEHTRQLADILNSESSIFTIYGESETILQLKDLLFFPSRSRIDYHLMLLTKKDFIAMKSPSAEISCRLCSAKDFKRLKRLQYDYHLEEVYPDRDSYPYRLEMNNFKRMLAQRVNIALFGPPPRQLPLSKAYVSASYKKSCQIGGVYTRKENRKQGLSSYCLSQLFKELFSSGTDSIYLFVNHTNRPAINLYYKLGFKTIANTSTLYF